MSSPVISDIAGLDAGASAALMNLNNDNARETSYLESAKWQAMIERAFVAHCVDKTGALLIAFDQDADYDSANFLWFREHMDSFVYVDRIVVSGSHRGQGVARKLYENLFELARAAGHRAVVCEVNRVPPNLGSDAFHDTMGFIEVGRAQLDDGEKTVRYLKRDLS